MNFKRIGIGLGSLAGAALAVVGGALLYDVAARKATRRREGHPAPDLAEDAPHPGPGDRAPEAFRPDPTAPVFGAEREALAPATMPVSGPVSGGRGIDRRNEVAPANVDRP
ncbi:hypothetical protein DFR49_3658 [Hephaestia caeni]|uniref:Uncharacterized protein n=1 Tax=Hephaestia caeni TaxID=645617 RepID=A0A397NJR8_9SPHN|nr:hypothetical protein [Hephaestia caeni]RIA37770.1 hypothetical protein DFR49_3658 [Hephaestia caeni]